MASPERVRELLEQRKAKIDAYRVIVAAPAWRTVYLDLMHFASMAPNDARSAGRYDVLARMMTAAEGINIPEVVTEKTDG